MGRRRGDYRTWEELSRQERQRGLAVLSAVGLAAVIVVVLVMGGGGVSAQAGAAPPPTVGPDARLASWYATTAQVRTRIVTAVTAVRADISASNGTALRPACVGLGQAVDQIGPLGLPPDAGAARSWSDGAGAYAAAVSACGNLFDGTAVPPPVLLRRTTDALDTADGYWTRLAARVGAPAQIVP